MAHNMKTRTVSLFMAVLISLLLTGCGKPKVPSKDVFHYGSGVTWGMSPAEVLEIESLSERALKTSGQLQTIHIQSRRNGHPDASRVDYFFSGSALVYIQETSAEDADGDTILKGLIKRYGPAKDGECETLVLVWRRLGLSDPFDRTAVHLLTWDMEDYLVFAALLPQRTLVFYVKAEIL